MNPYIEFPTNAQPRPSQRLWVHALERITAMMIKGLGDEQALDTAAKELGEERDRVQAELAKEPPASNISVHPSAVAAFAKSLTTTRDYLHSAKAKLELTLHVLHDRGDLHRLVREVVASVTLFRDEDGRMCADVATWLDHFTVDGGQTLGGCQNGSGGGAKTFVSGRFRASPSPL